MFYEREKSIDGRGGSSHHTLYPLRLTLSWNSQRALKYGPPIFETLPIIAIVIALAILAAVIAPR